MSEPIGYTGEHGTADEAGDQEEARAQQVARDLDSQGFGKTWPALRADYPFEAAQRILHRAVWLHEQGEPE